MRAMRLLPLATALTATSCASMKPGLGFEQVRTGMSERTGLRVHWIDGSSADREVAAAVNAMLERELTARDAVQLALFQNHELQAIYEELHLAQADLVQAGLLRNPVLSGEVRFGVGAVAGTGAVLDVAQDFVSLLYMPLRKGRAEAAFEAAKIRVLVAVLDVARDVRLAFYDYQAAEQTKEMRQTVLEATRVSYELAKRLRQAGNNRELDVINEQDLHEQSKIDLAIAEVAVIQARERLNAVMGLWGQQTRWRAASRLPTLPDEEISLDGVESRAIEASQDLAVARREIEIAARSLGIATPFAWLTDIEVGAAAERELDGGWSVGPSLSLPIPLFDQGQASVGRASAQLRQASQHYYARAVEVRAHARSATGVLSSARDRVRFYERVVLPLRQQLVNQTQLQYNAMQVSAFQLLEAKRSQIKAGAEYIESLRDYWTARATLEQILSGRLSTIDGVTMGGPEHTGVGELPERPLEHRHTGPKLVASPE